MAARLDITEPPAGRSAATRVPPHDLQAEESLLGAMMLSAGVPLGNLVLGPAADIYGVKTIILVQASFIALATFVLALRRVG